MVSYKDLQKDTDQLLMSRDFRNDERDAGPVPPRDDIEARYVRFQRMQLRSRVFLREGSYGHDRIGYLLARLSTMEYALTDRLLARTGARAPITRALTLRRRSPFIAGTAASFIVAAIIGFHVAALVPVGIGLLLLRKARQRPMHPDVVAFLQKRKMDITALRKDIDIFMMALPMVRGLEGNTGHADMVFRRAFEKYASIEDRFDAITQAFDALVDDLIARHQLAGLKKTLGDILPTESTGGVTQDLTSHVAVLDAQEHIDRRRQGLPENGSATEETTSSEDASARRDRDRE